MVRQPGYLEDARRVEREFAGIVANVIELTRALQNIPGAAMIDASWLDVPEELKGRPETRAAIEAARYFKRSPASSQTGWIQHGDLSVENVFLDPQNGRIEVLDWVDLAGGFPPLYDLFSLCYSTGYLAPADEAIAFPTEEERWMASFSAVFLSDRGFAQTVRDLILHVCQQLDVRPELIPSLLMEFLLVRSHYFQKKSLVQHRVHLRLLQLCTEQRQFVFGRFPVGHLSAVPLDD